MKDGFQNSEIVGKTKEFKDCIKDSDAAAKVKNCTKSAGNAGKESMKAIGRKIKNLFKKEEPGDKGAAVGTIVSVASIFICLAVLIV